MVTHLASLFEYRQDTINLEALVNEAKTKKLVAEDRVKVARDALSEVQPLRPKLAILRSNLFSHRSGSLSYEGAFEKAAITPFQFRDLTDAGRVVANALLTGRGQREVFFTGTTMRHTESMLDALKEPPPSGQ